ncbi:uncharacterized protein ARMOST_20638 [Armillaria ostoyae]|uniref:Uncharacterized protein n=1 Tax=Armillaria ostoyae TaxID=47428 RepID=A0A284S806_ARMOS|nr:uncharacterized protein ARMOST_20638 [Armillaria ostoyae]
MLGWFVNSIEGELRPNFLNLVHDGSLSLAMGMTMLSYGRYPARWQECRRFRSGSLNDSSSGSTTGYSLGLDRRTLLSEESDEYIVKIGRMCYCLLPRRSVEICCCAPRLCTGVGPRMARRDTLGRCRDIHYHS